MSSSDDFFRNFEAPAPAAPRQRKVPPPPPPRRPSSAAGTSTAKSMAGVATVNTNRASPANKPTSRRPQPPSRPARPPAPAPAPRPTLPKNTTTSSYYGSSTSNVASSQRSLNNSARVPAPVQASYYGSNAATSNNFSAPADSDPFAAWAPAPHAHQQPDVMESSALQPSMIQPVQQPMIPAAQPFFGATQHDSSQQLAGVMDGGSLDTSDRGSNTNMHVFVPEQQSGTPSKPTHYDGLDDLPLLEELGVNIPHILMKTKAVVLPSTRLSGALVDPDMIVQDADLVGPLCFALMLGGELLLTGKIHFGYIYGFGVFGCVCMTLILNLMAPQAVSVWTVASILGYALLPVNVLAALKIVLVNLANLQLLGRLLAVLTVLWSTTASTRLLEVGCNMREQRYLLAYPIALLYSAFVLITIF